MKKKLSFYILSLLTASVGVASPLTPEQALNRAFSSDGSQKALARRMSGIKPEYVAEAESGLKGVYVFNNPEGGFMLLSADDLGFPVLGYSHEGKIEANNLPIQLQAWLEDYCNQIEFASNEGVNASFSNQKMTTRAERRAISPMISTKWDQGVPYNNDCPTIKGKHAYTGCVATAMAQVMNYFKYPVAGQGRVTVNVSGINSSMTLEDFPFDWSNMLDNYISGKYNDEQAAAVANLMKACGYSVNMSYGTSSSGAQSSSIGTALKRYFGYDQGITFEARLPYSSSQWEEKVYSSLAGGCPVLYGGRDSEGNGHSFVCDGYDKDGFFHFNWGWGGTADGYFLLNALNPEVLGTGGGAGGGYNFDQDCVFNIKKPDGGTVDNSLPLLSAGGGLKVDNVSGNRITIGLQGYYDLSWRNNTESTLNLALGGVFSKEGSEVIEAIGSATLAGVSTVKLAAGTYYPYQTSSDRFITAVVTVPSSLPDGTYKMTLSCREADHPSWPYYPILTPYGYPNYIMVTKSGSTIKATTVSIPTISLNETSIEGPLYYRRKVALKGTFSNPSEYELTCVPMLVLKNMAGEDQFISSSFLITLQPGEKIEKEWNVTLYAVNGAKAVTSPTQFKMSIYNDYTGETMDEIGTVTMDPNPGEATIKTNKSEIVGCSTEPVDIGGVDYNIYKVTNKDSFTLSMSMTVTKGYFDSNVYVGILRVMDGAYSPTETVSVVDQVYSKSFRAVAGDEINLEVPVSFPQAQPGIVYVLNPRYVSGTSQKSLGQVRFWIGDGSGVNEIMNEEDLEKEYYTLQGIRIAEPVPGEYVIEKAGNKVVKKIYR